MNEYSRELMHMTTSEKADYNRRYYQRNKQYWKDYYKTGHGIGRKPGALSGVDQDYRDTAVGNDPTARSIKYETRTPDGRPKYVYDTSNADYYRSKHKSLDNINIKKNMEQQNYVNSMEQDSATLREHERGARYRGDNAQADSYAKLAKDYERRTEMARGDLVRNLALDNPATKYRSKAGPRTANIEKTVGVALKSALTRSVRSIKSNANKAMKFIESLFK
jgi:hypothetical protein